MEYKPKRPCSYPNCAELVEAGEKYCKLHKPLNKRTYDDNRPSASARGYDKKWEKVRKMFLKEHPLCEDCLRYGVYTPAQEVHHIEKVKDRPDRRLDPTNLMALCKACHNRRTAKGE